jgi:hypothetical protein
VSLYYHKFIPPQKKEINKKAKLQFDSKREGWLFCTPRSTLRREGNLHPPGSHLPDTSCLRNEGSTDYHRGNWKTCSLAKKIPADSILNDNTLR